MDFEIVALGGKLLKMLLNKYAGVAIRSHGLMKEIMATRYGKQSIKQVSPSVLWLRERTCGVCHARRESSVAIAEPAV